jgi:uroporphyrinogen decarboxylase
MEIGMPKETMTPRERWLAVLLRRVPDRVPMDFWGTAEITEQLMAHFGCGSFHELMQNLHVDYAVAVSPKYVGPPCAPGQDVFGIRYNNFNYGTGTYDEAVYAPLAEYTTVEGIEAGYHWPLPDWWDYSELPTQIRDREDYPIRGGGSEPFLTYKYLRGNEQAMMDLVENPEMVEYCLGKLFDLAYENTRRIFEAIPGKVLMTYVAEDMGGQNDLMFSPRHIRRFLFPGMKRLIDLTHQAGAVVFHHNDGNCSRILPELVDLGIDILNPIQWRAVGMERETLKQKYGDKLIFHGAMDNQYTLPFGTVEDVRQEVHDNLRILGESGGYILAPCHNIQPITPIENIAKMYEEGYLAGWQ